MYVSVAVVFDENGQLVNIPLCELDLFWIQVNSGDIQVVVAGNVF